MSSVCPIVVPLIKTLSISNEPPLINPVVVIADAPLLIVPNPEVIEPVSNAPVVTKPVAVVIEFCVAVVTVPATFAAVNTFVFGFQVNPVSVSIP